MSPLVEIGLTDLPNSGSAPPLPPCCDISSYPIENTRSFLRSRDQFVFCNIGSHPEKNTKNKSNTIMGMFASVCVIALQMPKERLLFIPVFLPQSCPTFTLSTYLLQLIIGSTYFQIWKYLEGNHYIDLKIASLS